MKTVILASAFKQDLSTKVGLGFAHESGRILLTSINPNGLFGNSDLLPGLELVTINGANVGGMTANEVKAILGSIHGEVVVQAQPVTQTFTYTQVRQQGYLNEEMPILFKSKQVPKEDWNQFVSAYQTEMLPHVDKTLNLERNFNKLMDSFVGQQMVRGYVGFGTESMQEKKAHTLTHHAAVEHSNLSMVATNLLAEANMMFNPYGIWAKLVFEEHSVPKIPGVDGIKLSTMVPIGVKFIAPAAAS